MPHCWLSDNNGSKLSTHDLIGSDDDFVLLTTSDTSSWQQAAQLVFDQLQLRIRVVTIGQYREIYDSESRWESLKRVGSDGAVLVRPDNIVAWMQQNDSNASDNLLAALLSIAGK